MIVQIIKPIPTLSNGFGEVKSVTPKPIVADISENKMLNARNVNKPAMIDLQDSLTPAFSKAISFK